MNLFDDSPPENSAYLVQQIITYIGNKRSLLDPIRSATEDVQERLGGRPLRILDAFSGSGIVARLFKRYANELIVNDIEDYSRIVNDCFLSNASMVPADALRHAVTTINERVATWDGPQGFIERMYAPNDEANITVEDRVFYTRDNARRLDAYRQLIAEYPSELHSLLLGPLLSRASVHANTSGVFKGFYKDPNTGAGRFGGSGNDALERILGQIILEPPVLSEFDCDYEIFQMEANDLAHKVGNFDLVYLDPPYNQHPYGSNYFMLNLLANYQEPQEISRVSGIPVDWRRSDYNVRSRAFEKLDHLLRALDTRFVLLSYNDEGFITTDQIRATLEDIGTVKELQLKYATFRGSRNLRDRNIHVTEHLFLVEKTK